MIKCGVCKKVFKNSCVDVSPNEVRMLNANKGLDWSCKQCRTQGSDIKELKALILKLQEDIQTLKTENRGAVNSHVSDEIFEEIVEEIHQRDKRRCNLMVFGVPEQITNIPSEAKLNKDKGDVVELLKTVVPDFAPRNLKLNRLGIAATDKTRSIRITLESEHQVLNFIRNAKNLRSSKFDKKVSLSFDRTPRQQSHYKKIRNQLRQRLEEGEDNLKIKHVNGIPKIVSLN